MDRYSFIGLLVFLSMLAFPQVLKSADWKTGLTKGWSIENMQSWGEGNLAVDFGSDGLWNFKGMWMPLSRLNPKMMAAWGSDRLVVDFPGQGLWSYDGCSWTKIAR